LAVTSLALIAAPSAGAATFKSCGSLTIPGTGKATYKAKGLKCAAAKKVLQNAGLGLCFDNAIPGWKKEWRALPSGGRELTLKQGAKAIRTNACSPK
jgi:hypothetical protein